MQKLLRTLTENFADSTSLLALATAVLLIFLYASVGHPLLLVACLPYTFLGAVGIYSHQQKMATSNEQATATEAKLSSSQIPASKIEAIATRMGVTVDGLVRASHAINDVTVQQATSAQEQAEVIGTTNTMLDSFLELSEKISDQARSISQSAQTAATMSETGQHALQETLASMQDIRHQVEAIGETIVILARFTRRIDDIINSVGEIATQSNLLALNASIEAARAGTHGRGFAVVADEVRSLAKQSTQAASAVRSILREIQKAMKNTVEATQSGMNNVETGVSKTREANDVIIQLANSVKESREAVSSIYEVIRQQANGMEEIAINMDRIQLITRQNLASTRTVESVSANLSRLASDLQNAVSPEDLSLETSRPVA